jgi:hypothetical protein
LRRQCQAAVCRSPPRSRVDRRKILRRDGRRRTEGRVVQRPQILTNRAARSNWVQCFNTLHPALAVRVGFDQTGIDSKTLTAHQPLSHATAHHSLEHVPKYIAVTEADNQIRISSSGSIEGRPVEL